MAKEATEAYKMSRNSEMAREAVRQYKRSLINAEILLRAQNPRLFRAKRNEAARIARCRMDPLSCNIMGGAFGGHKMM
jgi:hypothetical protein